MRTVTWTFDFVSPFAYIGFHRLRELPPGIQVAFRPVLFAGLLNHWGQKGPAELPTKRTYTYRWTQWWAQSLGLPFRYPAGHPFNPLHHLRLCIAAGGTRDVVGRIFEALWTTGGDPRDPGAFSALCRAVGTDAESLEAPVVKDTLRRNTEAAAQAGVFGVPTLEIDRELFWGADAMDFAKAFLADPAVLRNPEMARIDALPVAAARKAT